MTTPGEPPTPDLAWESSSVPPPEPARPALAAGLAVVAVLAVAVLGAPLGLLWSLIAPDVPVEVTSDGLVFAQSQPEQPVAADAWFVLLSVPFGALVAIAAWVVLPRIRGPVGLLALTVGGLAAGPIAWGLGRRVGLGAFEAAAAQAPPGTQLGRPADLRVLEVEWWPPMVAGVPVMPALAAAATYTLLAAWSPYPTLRP